MGSHRRQARSRRRPSQRPLAQIGASSLRSSQAKPDASAPCAAPMAASMAANAVSAGGADAPPVSLGASNAQGQAARHEGREPVASIDGAGLVELAHHTRE